MNSVRRNEVSERCEQGKLGRPDRDGSVPAGWEIRAGPGISLGAARPTSHFCYIFVLYFIRGEKLETALLSISILCSRYTVRLQGLTQIFLRRNPCRIWNFVKFCTDEIPHYWIQQYEIPFDILHEHDNPLKMNENSTQLLNNSILSSSSSSSSNFRSTSSSSSSSNSSSPSSSSSNSSSPTSSSSSADGQDYQDYYYGMIDKKLLWLDDCLTRNASFLK